jgi:hypothetical protein
VTRNEPNPSLDDVLNAFSVESTPDRKTLERYLRRYPQYAEDLVDLFRELHRITSTNAEPETPQEAALIDAAWREHAAAVPAVTDPLAVLSIEQLRALAKAIDVPRQVVTAIRERRVVLASMPKHVLRRLAEGANSTLEALVGALAAPASSALARSRKADDKPRTAEAVTFERILIDAGVPEDKRARLLKEDD